MRGPLLLLEFNEVNFDHVGFYCRQGRLPALKAMLERHGLTRTHSERRYEDLEPWIQWVTAHTGLTLAEHRVYRLGDITRHDIPQIWEEIEAQGLKVGAISPMNAKYRLRDAAFFVPDPWTQTEISASPMLRGVYRAIVQAVNENAQSRVTPAAAGYLLAACARYVSPRRYARYLRLILGSRSRSWRRAMLLDRLLCDVFIGELKRTRPDFASFFLNAAAHIQHHYMFCAAAYDGPNRNPAWYVDSAADPILEIYELYDEILADVQRACPNAQIMIATGLHQVPHERLTYYWRLKDHAQFLRSIGVTFERVEPRMSRDFLIVCRDAQAASAAARVLQSAIAHDGAPLFEIDNRGTDVFAMLSYAGPIEDGFTFSIDAQHHTHLPQSVAFVALKNGEHHETGYLIDSATSVATAPKDIPLAQLPTLIRRALGCDHDTSVEGSGAPKLLRA